MASTWLYFAGCAWKADKERTVEYVDTVIAAKGQTEVLDEPSLTPAEIKVEPFEGIVQLSGFVRSQAEIARRVNGVNEMRLK